MSKLSTEAKVQDHRAMEACNKIVLLADTQAEDEVKERLEENPILPKHKPGCVTIHPFNYEPHGGGKAGRLTVGC
jgi:hypothetical protein